MKKVIGILLLGLLTFTISSCSSDDDEGEKSTYPFVGKQYVYQWTLQNTSDDYQLIIKFTSDSTFTVSCARASNGKLTNGEKKGKYSLDGMNLSFQIGSFYTKLRGQDVQLIRGRFTNAAYSEMKVLRTLEFSSGKKRTDWLDFDLRYDK